MNRERLREVYDRRAATYDRSVGAAERFLLGDLRRAFGAELRGETLEVGIGSGLNLPDYARAVTRAVGVDLSVGMLAEARRRAAGLGRRVDLIQADAEALPFADASFDTVAVSLALCTVPDPAAALREVTRVCRPGGRVVLLEHVRSPVLLVDLVQRLLAPLQQRVIGCQLRRETVDLARTEGFTIESERARLFDVVRLVVARPPSEHSSSVMGADAGSFGDSSWERSESCT